MKNPAQQKPLTKKDKFVLKETLAARLRKAIKDDQLRSASKKESK